MKNIKSNRLKFADRMITLSIDDNYLADRFNCDVTPANRLDLVIQILDDEIPVSGRNPTLESRCQQWLQGLCSAVSVPFSWNEIIRQANLFGIVFKNEADEQRLMDDYWENCGYALATMIRHHVAKKLA